MSDNSAPKYRCDFCGKYYQMGNHVYDVRYIKAYDLKLCNTCDYGNRDGVGPYAEEKLITHLNVRGIPLPKRNDKGGVTLPPKGN